MHFATFSHQLFSFDAEWKERVSSIYLGEELDLPHLYRQTVKLSATIVSNHCSSSFLGVLPSGFGDSTHFPRGSFCVRPATQMNKPPLRFIIFWLTSKSSSLYFIRPSRWMLGGPYIQFSKHVFESR